MKPTYSKNVILSPIYDLIHYRELILFMVKAELKTRHFRKMLGPLWWILEPTLFALMFYFLVAVLFRYSTGHDYLIFILISVMSWRWFSRAVDNGPNLLLSFQSIISQTNFRVVPILYTNLAVELIHFLFGLVVVFIMMPFFGILPTINLVYLPLVMIVQGTFILGLVSLLASAGAFLRDLQQVVGVITGIWFYLSPGLYPTELIPEQFRVLYELNPFATILPAYRAIIMDGTPPDLLRLALWFPIFVLLLYVGFRTIEKRRGKYFKAM